MYLSGISMSGSCLGTFVLAPVSSLLSEHYGWKSAVALYAGIRSIFDRCRCLTKWIFFHNIIATIKLLNISILFIALLSLTCIEGFLFRPLKNNTESEVDDCNKHKNLNMRYTQRNVMIGERDIKFVSDQQNQHTSNQGNISINCISRALYIYIYIYIYIHIYKYPISDWIFLSTETDEVYYGHHESSEKHEHDLNTEENKVLPSNYQCIDMV